MVPDERALIAEASVPQVDNSTSPFMHTKVGGVTWLAPPDVNLYRAEFEALGPNPAGKLNGQQARARLIESKLPSTVLHRIWGLADADKDGYLTLHEFALAAHFVKMKLD